MDVAVGRMRSGRPRGGLLWALALVITLAALVYQRSVGPTRPVRGTAVVGGERISYKLKRSAGGTGAYDLKIRVPDESFGGTIRHTRHKAGETWQDAPMVNVPAERGGRQLVGSIPRQPPGGKVAYSVVLWRGEEGGRGGGGSGRARAGDAADEVAPGTGGAESGGDAAIVTIPPGGPLVMRFRGHVPLAILIPHVALMFLGMLWSNRTGLEALRRDGRAARLTQWSLVLLGVGGLILGPIVQWHAFGEAWTGIPFGWDLTDNKTLIACVGWLAAFAAVRRAGGSGRGAAARYWILGAALVTLVIFSIPHSVMGTELDYATGQRMIAR